MFISFPLGGFVWGVFGKGGFVQGVFVRGFMSGGFCPRTQEKYQKPKEPKCFDLMNEICCNV